MENYEYYSEVRNESKGIQQSFEKFQYNFLADSFIIRFENIEGYPANILGIPLHLWKKYKSTGCITMDDYKEEFINCAGQKLFEQERREHPDEYEKLFILIEEFIYNAAHEYYSGFWGKV